MHFEHMHTTFNQEHKNICLKRHMEITALLHWILSYPSDTFVRLFLLISILRQRANNWFRKVSLAVVNNLGKVCHVLNCYISSDRISYQLYKVVKFLKRYGRLVN